MKRQLAVLLGALLLSLLMAADALAQQLAFPTAEGFGRFTKGGRGGTVYIVSNLNDSGAGSLRACATASGPRICVFSTSGTIDLQSRIIITQPFLTIAGQTSPGGIQLRNNGPLAEGPPIDIRTDDVILRHFWIRPGFPTSATWCGSATCGSNSTMDAVLAYGSRLIFDHMTFGWGNDETFNIVGNGGSSAGGASRLSQDITVQWSMIHESQRNAPFSQGNHSRANYIGYGPGDRITFVRNATIHSTRRNPNLGVVGQIDWINNVLYNYGQYAGETYSRHGAYHLNFIGNATVAGPDTTKIDNRNSLNIFDNDLRATLYTDLYLDGNIDINRLTDTGDERLVLDPKDWAYNRASPVGLHPLSVTAGNITSAAQAWKDVLTYSGAGANISKRDVSDARVVNHARTCSGAIIDSANVVGGWPVFSGGAAPTDADADGMSDAWETARGLNPASAADRNGDLDSDGYTNLEEYLNELAGDQDGSGNPISRIGTGTGTDPAPRCGFTFSSGAATTPQVNRFTALPRSVAPGGTVTLDWEVVRSSSVKGNGPNPNGLGGVVSFLTGPTQFTGNRTYTMPSNIGYFEFDLIPTNNSQDDWVHQGVWVTPDGSMPAPTINLSDNDADNVLNFGDSIQFSWVVDTVRNSRAGECIGAGAGWAGYKPVTGLEVFFPSQSGPYTLTCTGPGGTSVATINLTVNGGTPPPPPPPPPPPATPILTLSPLTITQNEGNSGSTAYTFTIARTVSTAGVSSASYAVTGTGSNPAVGADFAGGTLPSGTISFSDTDASETLTINVAGDTTVELNETWRLTLSSPVNSALDTNAFFADATITNDDSPPPSTPVLTIAANNASVNEGNSGTTNYAFSVTRADSTSGTSSATWTVTPSGASPAAASDFVGGAFPTGTVSFVDTDALEQFNVQVQGDTTFEATEMFTVTLSAPVDAVLGSPSSASGQIANDDTAPVLPSLTIAADAASAAEGNSGTTAFGFTVTRTGDTSGASSANWAVSSSIANLNDFVGQVLPSGTVSFTAGQATRPVTINVAGDTTSEPDELFTVTLTAPSGATLGSPNAATATITNDDTAPVPIFDEGVRVRVKAGPGAPVYRSPGGTLVTTQPAGRLGTIVRCSSIRAGAVYWRVAFDTGRDGWIQQSDIEVAP